MSGRPKHFYSIYLKMKSRAATFEQIFDLFGLRIVTADKGDCYRALGVVHDLWIPVQDRFKDYIATPKSNLYQSLHTTVRRAAAARWSRSRSARARCTARPRRGVAAHYVYKEGGRGRRGARRASWAASWRQTADWQATASDDEYMEFLRTALYQDEVFVYTPRRELQAPAQGRHAARLRVPDPHRGRLPLRRRARERRARAAAPRAAQRRHGRDHHLAARRGRTRTGSRSCARRRRARKIRHWLRPQHRDDAVALGQGDARARAQAPARSTADDDDARRAARTALGCDRRRARCYAQLGQGTLSLTQVMRRLAPGEGRARSSGSPRARSRCSGI